MLIAASILGTLIIIFGIEDMFSSEEWIASILFIFAIWVISEVIFKIKSIIAKNKRRKRIKELQTNKQKVE